MTRLNDYAAGRYKQLRARKGERVSSSPSFCYTRSMKQCLGLPASSSDGHSTPPPPRRGGHPRAHPRNRGSGRLARHDEDPATLNHASDALPKKEERFSDRPALPIVCLKLCFTCTTSCPQSAGQNLSNAAAPKNSLEKGRW